MYKSVQGKSNVKHAYRKLKVINCRCEHFNVTEGFNCPGCNKIMPHYINRSWMIILLIITFLLGVNVTTLMFAL